MVKLKIQKSVSLSGFWLLALVVVFLTGCSTTPTQYNSRSVSLAKPVDLSHSHKVKSLILSQYQQWKGTPYQYGGTTLRGVDCSAFVQNTYRSKLGYPLSRTTRTQIKEGVKVAKHDLKVGDIVFFKTGKTSLHNGIYIGKSQFVHASSSKGVTISSLDNVYWKKNYYLSKRIN
ncbi:MAG: NlpC/P60 family protein [Thiomicrorhabdus sp.]|nr:NlpC/P60 family protein [Thiomicrorhabdus sp.]